MNKSTLQIYFIRHGETAWALSGQHTGHTDLSLTKKGEDEARELGKHLQHINFSHVLTSPLKRAHQTCHLVGLNNISVTEPDLAEWDYGDYEGLTSVDISKVQSNWDIFRDGCPGGEMPAQMSGRVDRLIANLRKLSGNIALFSHGQLGCVLAARWIGLSLLEAQHFVLGTASLSILGYSRHHPDAAVITLWNETFLRKENEQ